MSDTFFKLLTVGLTVFHLQRLPVDNPASFSIELTDNPAALANLQMLS